MRTLANILWHIPFLGFLTALWTYLFGVLLMVTVVAAPVGLGLMEFAKFLFAPFSRAMVDKADLGEQGNKVWQAYSTVVRIVYFPLGLVLAVCAAIQAVLLCVTIIGIPLAIVVFKSLGTYFNPVNKRCVSLAESARLNRMID